MSWTSSKVSSRARTTRVKPELAQRLGAGAVVDGQLRAGVQFQLGKVLADDVIDAQVLNDEGIDADVGEGGERLDQFGQFIVADERVEGDEDAPPRRQGVGVGDDLGQFLEGEVLGLGAGGELFQSQIDGVGAVMKRSEGGVGPPAGLSSSARCAGPAAAPSGRDRGTGAAAYSPCGASGSGAAAAPASGAAAVNPCQSGAAGPSAASRGKVNVGLVIAAHCLGG